MEGKKESWIETLIELLNEYDPCIASDGEHRDNLWGYAYQWHSAVFPKELAESYIITARYGFIKWLVENDKIEREKFWNSETKSSKYSDFELSYDTPREDYTNTLLMELAIQDEPIEFLISILKNV